MLARVTQLANDVLHAFRAGEPIPVREGKASLRSVSARRACPKHEVIPRVSEVLVSFEVPGATSQNTELWWDDGFHTLSLHVTLSGEGNDLRAVLAFTSDVDGTAATATLKDATLRVRLPRREVDTFTAFPEVLSAAVSYAAPLCA